MSITYCALGSGSSGNSFWVTGGDVQLLVDCGLSARQIAHRLDDVGGRLDDIDAIICTHGHRDHLHGTEVLACQRGLPIWVTPGAGRYLSKKIPAEQIHEFQVNERFSLGGMSIRSVQTLHDIPESVAFVLSDGEVSMGFATDLGFVTPIIIEAMQGLDGLVLEMNHDEQMLERGPYPQRLKKRILSNYGHLSNTQGAELLRRVVHPGLRNVSLAHLSETNNTPELARSVAEEALRSAGATAASIELSICEQARPGRPVVLKRGAGRMSCRP